MKPLSVIELWLANSPALQFHPSLGSVLHGALMGMIDSDYADHLHTMQLRPYSQCLYYCKERATYIWRLASFNEEAAAEILDKALSLNKIYLRHKNAEVTFNGSTIVQETDFQELLDKHFGQIRTERKIKLEFLSPTSFKSNGSYMIYPSERLILGSLLNKWNLTSPVKLQEEHLLEDLTGETYTNAYSLRMNSFSLESTWIPAFQGNLTLGLKGNIMANRVIRLLAEFSQFSGIGIKTALGMGGINCSFA